MSRQLRLPVPTHIVTGALNSGKTSGILHWLASKPPEEVWAVIVNEWGAVGIDAAALDAHANVTVRQLAGGCMCCVTTVSGLCLQRGGGVA
jgi:G3E family GTPase